jgi:hypothetical protein
MAPTSVLQGFSFGVGGSNNSLEGVVQLATLPRFQPAEQSRTELLRSRVGGCQQPPPVIGDRYGECSAVAGITRTTREHVP